MKILIIGGSGFIGKALVRKFRTEEPKWKITVLDDLSYSYETYDDDDNIEFNQSCLRLIDSYHLSDFDVVINLSCVHLLDSRKNPLNDLRINTEGVLKLLNNLQRPLDMKYIHFSTGSVLSILSTYSVTTHYAISKLAGELYTTLYMEKYNLKASIVRPFGVYGPGGINVVNKFVEQAKNGTPYTIHKPGTQLIRPTHIDDVCSITKLIIDKDAWGHIFNAIGKQIFTIFGLASYIDLFMDYDWGTKNDQILIDPPVEYDTKMEFLHKNLEWSAKKYLDWEQTYTFDERLVEMLKT